MRVREESNYSPKVRNCSSGGKLITFELKYVPKVSWGESAGH